jgi:CRP/FNR family transcriptional regulator
MDIQKQFPYFHDTALIAEIEDKGTLKTVPAGTVLMDIGSYIKFMPLVVSGSIKILREDEEGNELMLYYLEGGNTCAVSFTCCLRQEKSSIRAICEEETTLIMIPIQYMDEWMTRFREWKEFVMLTFSQRMEELIRTIDSIAFHSMDERLEQYLEKKAKTLKTKELNITHQEIAHDLHSSREAVSRLLKKLEKLDRVSLGRNKITLHL